jgi:hypothetical protein
MAKPANRDFPAVETLAPPGEGQGWLKREAPVAEVPDPPREEPYMYKYPGMGITDTPPVEVRANFTGGFGGLGFVDQETRVIPDWLACIGELMCNRHGEPKLVTLSERCADGEQFKAAVAEHIKKHGPNWSCGDSDFPEYLTPTMRAWKKRWKTLPLPEPAYEWSPSSPADCLIVNRVGVDVKGRHLGKGSRIFLGESLSLEERAPQEPKRGAGWSHVDEELHNRWNVWDRVPPERFLELSVRSDDRGPCFIHPPCVTVQVLTHRWAYSAHSTGRVSGVRGQLVLFVGFASDELLRLSVESALVRVISVGRCPDDPARFTLSPTPEPPKAPPGRAVIETIWSSSNFGTRVKGAQMGSC